MKTAILVVLLLFVGLALAEDRTPIKVTKSETVTKVVIIHAQMDNKQIELQCNEGLSGCTVLANGTYSMEVLPKNYGMYDCKNVDIYGQEKLGSYCLIEK